jgi:formylglycine-generating enzyme required for sulfatase activity
MPKVFISYRRSDSQDVTGRIYDHLERRFGAENVFFDVDSIPLGVDFREHLDEAVGRCDVLLAVIGDSWLESRDGERRLDDARDFVRIEIESALRRGIPVIPVLVGRAAMPAEQELPESLKPLAFRNAAEVRSGRDFGDHVARLIRGIERLQPVSKPGLPASFTNSIGMRFVLVKPGTFLMGSPEGEKGRFENEQQHKVTIASAFYLGVHQVTQGQWKTVMGNNPAYFSRGGEGKDSVKDVSDAELDLFPVEQVSWEDAQTFLKRLAARPEEAKDRREYRLPSEAEWEYACRGGPDSSPLPFHFDQPSASLHSSQANFDGNYPYGGAAKGPYLQRPSKVGSYTPNKLGLYDVQGNVWEWCVDWYAEYSAAPATDPIGPSEGSVRVDRGGCWHDDGRRSRAASRDGYRPSLRNRRLGFRAAAVPSSG